MKNANKWLRITALALVFIITAAACNAQSGGRTINSATALKEYLDSQPANTPDKPIRVSMGANGPMLKDIAKAIQSSGKYVYLTLTGSALTAIPEKAFFECECLAGITIPASVTSIGQEAFWGCYSLTSVTIPNSVTSIGVGAFRYCKSLTSVTIPNSVTSIGSGAFESTSLASITIPDSVTRIEDNAFIGCDSLTSVTIPNSVKSIGDSAFSTCSSLKSVTLPNGVIIIATRAFRYCKSLTSITIPNSVASIGEVAFDGCTSLTSVTFEGTIPADKFYIYAYSNLQPFPGDLRTKFYASNKTNGTPGTYTRPNGNSNTWTKQ